MLEADEPQQALDGLLAAHEIDLTDIVSLARLFEVLRLPVWPDSHSA